MEVVERVPAKSDHPQAAGLCASSPAAPALRRVCSWCSGVMAEGDPGAATSHGCCPACVSKVRARVAAHQIKLVPVAVAAPSFMEGSFHHEQGVGPQAPAVASRRRDDPAGCAPVNEGKAGS